MTRVADDERRHAEVSWAVAAWLAPRLTPAERAAVDEALRDAVRTLDGDPRLVRLLSERVWSDARMAA